MKMNPKQQHTYLGAWLAGIGCRSKRHADGRVTCARPWETIEPLRHTRLALHDFLSAGHKGAPVGDNGERQSLGDRALEQQQAAV